MKDKAAKQIISDYYSEYLKIRTPAKLLKLVATMMARLSIVWEFKKHGNLYGTEMAKDLFKHFSWKDKFLMFFHTKQIHAQQIHTTSLGILWNRCLRHLAAELCYELIHQNLTTKQIDTKWRDTLSIIEAQDLNIDNVKQIETLLATKGIDAVLASDKGYSIEEMCTSSSLNTSGSHTTSEGMGSSGNGVLSKSKTLEKSHLSTQEKTNQNLKTAPCKTKHNHTKPSKLISSKSSSLSTLRTVSSKETRKSRRTRQFLRTSSNTFSSSSDTDSSQDSTDTEPLSSS
eukprot:TRINITY_DN1930_c0_g1_i1.p1 TRINITY_DN1930_c0_g1~~TRINITY_DN1930_c0_g1_i1.p1  ORF type:complete len:286 (-),score=35.71 TRINITY_DN1930_c0_g1_i1:95-952(-)